MKRLRPCKHPGCRELTNNAYCDKHKPQETGYVNPYRHLYNNDRWRNARAQYLFTHEWCAECLKRGKHTLATEVDHKKPHKGDVHLFWARWNWQPLCKSCHSKKTMRENGGAKPLPPPFQNKKGKQE